MNKIQPMNREDHHHGGGFMNGFVMGAVIGAGVVFLLGTKKGKQVLQTLTENGFEGISEITDMLSDDDEGFEEQYTAEGEIAKKETPKSSMKPLKRLFKGIRK